MKKIVIIGLSGDSEFLTVQHFNYPGETIQAIDKFSEPGGKGFNQAAFLGSLGCDVSFITALGNDIQAEECINELKKLNVKPYIISKNMPTDYAVIITNENGENNVVVYNKASSTVTFNDVMKYRDVIDSADILLLQLEYPYEVTKKIINYAYENGIKVILNPAPARVLDLDLLRKVWILIPNEYEMSHIINSQAISRAELMKELEQYGLETCICTRGSRAVEFYRDSKLKRLPVPDVGVPVDTTGAGDVFCGGLVYGLTNNMSLDSAIVFAIHASSLSTLKHGVLHSFPTLDEIMKSVNKNK